MDITGHRSLRDVRTINGPALSGPELDTHSRWLLRPAFADGRLPIGRCWWLRATAGSRGDTGLAREQMAAIDRHPTAAGVIRRSTMVWLGSQPVRRDVSALQCDEDHTMRSAPDAVPRADLFVDETSETSETSGTSQFMFQGSP